MGPKPDDWAGGDDMEIDESPPSRLTVLMNRLLSDRWVWDDDMEIDESAPSKLLTTGMLSGPRYWWPKSTPISVFNTDWDDDASPETLPS